MTSPCIHAPLARAIGVAAPCACCGHCQFAAQESDAAGDPPVVDPPVVESPVLEAPFVDVVDVSVVNLDVYVTDKKGNRITGLTKDDFELLVEKKPVAITNFYAVEGGVASTESGVELEPEEDLDPRLAADARRRRVPEDQRLHLVVYVDNLNLRPFTRNRAIRYVRTFLRNRLRPGDEVMLVTYERALHIRHHFTSDPEIIGSALYEVEEMSGMGVHTDSDRRDILREIYEADNVNAVRGRATQYAESLFSDMRFTIDAMTEIVDTLAGLPGRKAILYVSDGLPMRAAEDIFHAMNDEFRNTADNILMDGSALRPVARFPEAHQPGQCPPGDLLHPGGRGAQDILLHGCLERLDRWRLADRSVPFHQHPEHPAVDGPRDRWHGAGQHQQLRAVAQPRGRGLRHLLLSRDSAPRPPSPGATIASRSRSKAAKAWWCAPATGIATSRCRPA